MQTKIFGIQHIYILCDKSYEKERYNYLLNWAKNNFPPDYYTISLYCYKDTIKEKDIKHYGIKSNILKPSEISLIINYNKVFEDILDKYFCCDSKHSNFLILESDVLPTKTWKKDLETQMKKVIDYDYYFLHVGNGGNDTFLPSFYGHTITNESNIYKCPSSRCTEAMVWSYKGVEKAVCYKNKPITLPLDFYFNVVATDNVYTKNDIKTWWGHPVCFVQGTANGTYSSTINDNIEIPNRLKGYRNINCSIDNHLLYTEDYIKRLLQVAFTDTVVTFNKTRPVNVKITDDSTTNDLCILISNEKIQNKNNVILQISKNLTLEENHCFVPEICYSSLLYSCERLINKQKYIDLDSYDYWFYIPNNIPVYYQYFANMLRQHSWTSDPMKKCYFSLCIEEYKPYSISDNILKCYYKNSIPIFKGCNIISNELFNKKSFINTSNFNSEIECYEHILEIVNNNNKLEEILLENVFLKNEIPSKLDLENGEFIKNLANKIKKV